jgi:hypothetical protein
MAYELQVNVAAILTAIEKADGTTSPGSTTGGNQRTYDQYNVNVALQGSGSFPTVAGQVADLSHTLVAGTKDFDLTAIPWAGDVSKTFDASGKKLVALIYRFAIANNAAGVLFGPQGANGYPLFGAAIVPRFYRGWNGVRFLADPAQAANPTNDLPAIAAGAKDLRFTGTIGDAWKMFAIFSA